MQGDRIISTDEPAAPALHRDFRMHLSRMDAAGRNMCDVLNSKRPQDWTPADIADLQALAHDMDADRALTIRALERMGQHAEKTAELASRTVASGPRPVYVIRPYEADKEPAARMAFLALCCGFVGFIIGVAFGALRRF